MGIDEEGEWGGDQDEGGERGVNLEEESVTFSIGQLMVNLFTSNDCLFFLKSFTLIFQSSIRSHYPLLLTLIENDNIVNIRLKLNIL